MSQEFTSPFDTNERVPPEIIANPYPSYHQLRTRNPVHWNSETPGWERTRTLCVLGALCGESYRAARLKPLL